MRYMFYCTPLFINGNIDTDSDVVDTDAYGEDNDDYVYRPLVKHKNYSLYSN